MQNGTSSTQARRPVRYYNRVAVLAQPGRESAAMIESLRRAGRNVKELLSLESVNEELAFSCDFDVLLMRVQSFGEAQVAMVHKVRERFPYSGLITLSPDIDANARYKVKDVPRHRLLLEPFELQDLPKLTEKLARGEGTPPRLHARVEREGECEIVAAEHGARIRGRFIDFAQMGSRLLVQPREPLKRGMRVELLYRSTHEPSRIHRIQSSVVWAELSSGIVGTLVSGPKQMVGLRFIAAL